MDPLKVSAQFAAFMWSLNHQGQGESNPRAAARFARDNWVAFLPSAHEGCGKLLIQLAKHPATGNRHRRRSPTRVRVPAEPR